MNSIQIVAIIFGASGLLGYSSGTANASTDYDLCVMGQMQGQNINMLPLAQKICNQLIPPPPPVHVAPIETDLTDEIEYNICSGPGEELAVCIQNPPKDKLILRVIGLLANRNPCIIDESGPYPFLYKPGVRRISEDLFFYVARSSWTTSNQYIIGRDPSSFNCYKIRILGYENCHSTWLGGASCL